MSILQDIDKAKHIIIEVDTDFLASASALYTYILRLHKKVSLICVSKEIDNRLSFLPWFDKIKSSGGSSADLKVSLKMSSLELYSLFEKNNIKLNQKMATSLYAGVLQETDGFTNNSVNGTIFAVAKQLIESGAEYKTCNEFILKNNTLASLRLKALMLQGMKLKDNATKAIMYISDDILKATGATEKDCFLIMNEALYLPHVKEVLLLKSDEQDKILKKIEKEL